MFDIDKIRNDFPFVKNNNNIVYFDNGATTLKPQTVIDKVNEFYNCYSCNIHRGDYDISFKVSKEYDETRTVIKKFLNAFDDSEIIFTSGATASLNLVAYGYGLNHLKKGDVILTTYLEHASNILPWFDVCKQTGAVIKYIPLNEDGTFNLTNYKKCFEDKNIKIVSLTHVSNVLGYINPIKEIVKIAHDNNVLVNVDGAQSVPHIKVDVKDLDLDFLSFSGHKMLGPSGIGVLYGKKNLLEKIKPMLYGGGSNARFNKDGEVILKDLPERLESGTPNIEGVLGLKAAFEYLMKIGMENIEEHDKQLIEYFAKELSKLDNIILYNPIAETGAMAFNVKGVFAQDAATYLNKNGICVRSGNQCAKLLNNVIEATEVIRASVYLYNSKEEVDRFINVLKKCTLEECIGAVI